MRIPIVFKLLALSFFSSLLIIIILSYNSYNYRYEELQQKFGLALQHIAVSTAADIPGDKHALIRVPGDENRREFREIQAVLQRKRKLHGIQRDTIYTFQRTQDLAYIPFAVMLHPKPFIADKYEPPPEVQHIIRRAYAGAPMRTSLYKTRFGQWISGIAPIRDGRGRVVGLVEVDYKVDKFFSALRVQYVRILFTGGVVTVLGLLLSLLIANSLSRPIKQLESASRAVQAGDYDTRVTMLTNDEFRVLGDTFNSMVSSIKETRDKQAVYADSLEEMVQERTMVLIEARTEADTILRNVTDGIFLLRKEGERYLIANEHSRALSSILETAEVGNADFPALLRKHCAEETARMTETYLEHMLNQRFDEEALEALNPLETVQFVFPDRNEPEKHKHLKFKFRRIVLDRRITQLMGVVTDVTEQRRLEHELEAREKAGRDRMGMLFKLLQVDAFMLSVFLEDAALEINIINNLLRDSRPGVDAHELLEGIYQSAHTIKGNAALLELDFLAAPAHAFEELIEDLRRHENLRGEDFLPLTIQLSEMSRIMDEIGELLRRLETFQAGFKQRAPSAGLLLLKSIEKTITSLGHSMGRPVVVHHEDFNYDDMPEDRRKNVKDALIQLARNSLKHGIEDPLERERAGKSPEGNISIASTREGETFTVIYRDDGRGLDAAAIKAQALASGTWSAREVGAWGKKEIAAAILTPGFSTAGDADFHAGRGRGMAVIAGAAADAGGTLEIDFQPGAYSEFRLTLPLNLDDGVT